MSSLADLLGQLKVKSPGRKKKSLEAMRDRLHEVLPKEVHGRIDGLVDTLKCAVGIRVGGQHGAARGTLAANFEALGITYPPADIAAAWEQIRDRVTSAINGLREELEAARGVGEDH